LVQNVTGQQNADPIGPVVPYVVVTSHSQPAVEEAGLTWAFRSFQPFHFMGNKRCAMMAIYALPFAGLSVDCQQDITRRKMGWQPVANSLLQCCSYKGAALRQLY
jgi:hypothetical protein